MLASWVFSTSFFEKPSTLTYRYYQLVEFSIKSKIKKTAKNIFKRSPQNSLELLYPKYRTTRKKKFTSIIQCTSFVQAMIMLYVMIFQASLHLARRLEESDSSRIFKKGDRSSASNYRPISLISVCSKVMELNFLHTQIMHHLDQFDILHHSQHGFRKKWSCETQFILKLQDLMAIIDEGDRQTPLCRTSARPSTRSHTCYLPTSCDTTPLVEMSCNGYPASSATGAIKSLSRAKHSTSVPVSSGVPQGSVFHLILIFINDMPEKTSATCRLFADDSFLYKIIRNQQDAQTLQQDLILTFRNGKKTWKSSFNPTKREVIRITWKKLQSTPLTAFMTTHYHQ